MRSGACELLAGLTDDPHHRVRGSAVRGLVRYGHASGRELLEMLDDERPLHRLAGLWVVERASLAAQLPAGWGEWSSRVAEMARAEPEAPVRERARRSAARMLARMRVGWGGRAVAVA